MSAGARTGWLFAAASLAWGVPYLFVALALEEVSVVFLVWSRAVLGAAVLLPLAHRRGLLAPLRGRLRAVTILATLDLAAPTLLVTAGVARLPSSLAGTLIASVPIMVALLALRLDPAERVRGLRLVGLGVGIVGVGLLLGVEVGTRGGALLGGLLVLGAAATYAGGALFYKREFSREPALGVLAAALAACAVMTTVPAVLSLPDSVPSPRTALWLVVLGVGCTAGGYLAFYALISRIGSGRATVITYVAPVIAVLGGVLVLGEPLTAGIVAGLLLVLTGSWLAAGGRPPGALEPASGASVSPPDGSAGKPRPGTTRAVRTPRHEPRLAR